MTPRIPPQPQDRHSAGRTAVIGLTHADLSPAFTRGTATGVSVQPQVLPGFDPPDPPGSRPLANRRFDLEPLASAMGVELVGPTCRTGNQHEPEWSIGCRELAERIHVAHRTVVRWRTAGIPRWGTVDGITVDMPDHIACTYAGMHPALIWPDWWAEESEMNDGR